MAYKKLTIIRGRAPIFYVTLVVVVFVLLIELILSLYFYKFSIGEDSYAPFFCQTCGAGREDRIEKILDPILGYRLRPNSILEDNEFEIRTRLKVNKFGFISTKSNVGLDLKYASLVQEPGIYKILVSGGEMAAGVGVVENEQTWPAILEDMLNDESIEGLMGYKSVKVFNTAIPGYSISQELDLFLNETYFYRANLIISMSGGNELYGYDGNPVTYSLYRQPFFILQKIYLSRQVLEVLFPNIGRAMVTLARQISHKSIPSFGFSDVSYIKSDSRSIYLKKLGLFKGVAMQSGASFLHILEPYCSENDSSRGKNAFVDFFKNRETKEFFERGQSKFPSGPLEFRKEKQKFYKTLLSDRLPPAVKWDSISLCNSKGAKRQVLIAKKIHTLILARFHSKKGRLEK